MAHRTESVEIVQLSYIALPIVWTNSRPLLEARYVVIQPWRQRLVRFYFAGALNPTVAEIGGVVRIVYLMVIRVTGESRGIRKGTVVSFVYVADRVLTGLRLVRILVYESGVDGPKLCV